MAARVRSAVVGSAFRSDGARSAGTGFRVLLRLPREVDALVTDGSWLSGLIDASPEGPSRPSAGHGTASLPFSHSVLDPEEVWLALRYFGRQRDLVESCEGFRDLDDLWGRLRAALVTGDRTGDRPRLLNRQTEARSGVRE
ncbi:MAG: hypothetical protein R3E12_08615 [Candidatus Eisenbacteria bacterium]